MYQLYLNDSYNGRKKFINRFKLIKKFIIIFIVLFILIFFVYTTYGRRPFTYKEIIVEPGESLWSIASKYNFHNDDIRKIVCTIKEINFLNNSTIQPGQRLLIPAN
jgi:hypothetical protein